MTVKRSMSRRFYTPEQLAEVLGLLNRGAAYHLIRTGAVPVTRIGQRLLIPVSAIDKLEATAKKAV